MKKPLFVALFAALSVTLSGQVSLVPFGSTWKYSDKGTNLGTAWRATAYNDASWASGPAQLGYGDGDESTLVSYGTNANKKYITTYFRKAVNIADASVFNSYSLSIKRDDGAVVYVNGVERFRTNMPTGSISYTTKASTDAADDGNTAQTITLASGVFSSGNNVIAVEVHQRAANSPDLSFDLQLTASGDATPPAAVSFTPADNAADVAIASNLFITFSENIQKGAGNIQIKEGGIVTQTIDVASSSVTVSGNTVTINPADFSNGTAVNVEMPAGVFNDLANNAFAGIVNNTAWNFTTVPATTGPQTLLPFGAAWRYLDNGSNPGTAWTGPSFSDAAWASGNAQLGYGDGDEATVVSYGTDAANKYVTTYFRKLIAVANPAAFGNIIGNVKRDDGVAIYVNGTEVYRNNLAAGAGYTTLASLASDDGATPQSFNFNPSLLVSGNNLIAVEIHQNAVTSSDISFDLELVGNPVGMSQLTRGPYLNSATQNGIVIRWRTDVPTNSKVSFGETAENLSQQTVDNTLTTEHVVALSGLAANTRYYYSIGSTTQSLQGDAANYFKTMPVAGSEQKIRVLAMGDMGNNSTNQVNVRNAYLNFIGANYTDAWLLLGDNAYNNGTDAEYQTNFFNIYQGTMTRNHVLWPAPGNHDYANSASRQADHAIPYYSMFTLPANGQAGGVASGTEAFYSYNYGNIHFVALDSYGWETGNTRLYDTLGPQITWLKQDLAANSMPWTIVYFHHPPYTKGSHNSDTESELINMRERVVRILERYKVDLVLNGHSHSYERSYLINGHYGFENTFNAATHALSTSSARYDGSANSCVYVKRSADVVNGIVYAVVGSAGQLGGSTSGYPHNAMYYSDVTNGGALFFEVDANRLDAKWICADGIVRDNFTIMKNVGNNTTMSIAPGTPTQLSASWIGTYNWSNGATSRSITVSPLASTTYSVMDATTCITDVFNIEVASGQSAITQNSNSSKLIEQPSLNVLPTVVKRGERVYLQTNSSDALKAVLNDHAGRQVQSVMLSKNGVINTDQLSPGVYFIHMQGTKQPLTRKIVVVE